MSAPQDEQLADAKGPLLCWRGTCHRHGQCMYSPCFLTRQERTDCRGAGHSGCGQCDACRKTATRRAADVGPTDRSLIVAINATGVFWSPGAVRESVAAPEINSPLARSIYAHALTLDRFNDLASLTLPPPVTLTVLAADAASLPTVDGLGDLPSRLMGWAGKARSQGRDLIELDLATVDRILSAIRKGQVDG